MLKMIPSNVLFLIPNIQTVLDINSAKTSDNISTNLHRQQY